MSRPLVSIGMPVFNEEKYISEALESLLSQTYPNLDIVVADNASADHTWQIIEEYAARDKRIRSIRHPENLGAPYNFRHVLDEARADYFMWAGAHDRWASDMVEQCMALLEEHPSVLLAAPQTRWIDMEGAFIKEDREAIDTRSERSPAGRALSMYKSMSRCNALFGLFRRAALLNAYPLPKVIGPDFIFLMRITAQGDVLSCSDAWWYRRRNRVEKASQDTYRRQIRDLQAKGIYRQFPLASSRLVTVWQLNHFPGSFIERGRLLVYSLWKLLLDPWQCKLLVQDLYLGAVHSFGR